MKVARTIAEVRRHVVEARRTGKSVALVPTMGALHEGHFSLIDAASKASDFVVVSIFVNPKQFGPNEDFRSYPRSEQADLAACRGRGVDLVFIPSEQEMYGSGAATAVTVSRLSETLCGRSRPTHFVGVCTVVAKLLNIVQPDKAFFGAKDFQQAVIIRQMVRDLNFPVEVVLCPTIRRADGLAMSSRNKRLSPAERTEAAELHKSLLLAERMIRSSHPPASKVVAAIRSHLDAHAPGGRPDYIQIVDPDELTDVETTDRPVLVALAVHFGSARLIDNILVDVDSASP